MHASSVHRVPAPTGRTREEDILLEIQPIVRANADDAKAAFREKGDDLTPSCRVGVQAQAPTRLHNTSSHGRQQLPG
jgi:hypothetical protein